MLARVTFNASSKSIDRIVYKKNIAYLDTIT